MKTVIDEDVVIGPLSVELDGSYHKCSKEYLTPDKYLLMINNAVSNGSADGHSD
jgi:hypothetical protein